MYLVNRFETDCRKSLIPFHAIWGLFDQERYSDNTDAKTHKVFLFLQQCT